MDNRTSRLLKALDPLAVELLSALLENELSEREVVEELAGAHQPNVHKKLARLADVGLICLSDSSSTRGTPWTIVAPQETAELLIALLSLAEILDAADRRERMASKERLERALNGPGLHLVKANPAKSTR